MNAIEGRKSYLTALGIALVSLYHLTLPGEATYADPSGDYSAAVGEVIGALGLMLAAAVASLRHALAKVERRLNF